MQHIQDKDFDQRLKDQFEDEEMPIPADSWTRLENALYPVAVKKQSKGWWIAAASVLLIGSIGWYVNSDSLKQDRQLAVLSTSKQQHGQPGATAYVDAAGDLSASAESELITELSGNTEKEAKVVVPTKLNKAIVPRQPSPDHAAANTHSPALENSRAAGTEPSASKVDPRKEKLILAALQPSLALARLDQKRQLAGPEKLKPFIEQETSLTSPDGDDASGEQSGIRNIGDLVNYVVEKMDKRAEKILKFKTDDDNSSLIAINIGLLKFNPKKDK